MNNQNYWHFIKKKTWHCFIYVTDFLQTFKFLLNGFKLAFVFQIQFELPIANN